MIIAAYSMTCGSCGAMSVAAPTSSRPCCTRLGLAGNHRNGESGSPERGGPGRTRGTRRGVRKMLLAGYGVHELPCLGPSLDERAAVAGHFHAPSRHEPHDTRLRFCFRCEAAARGSDARARTANDRAGGRALSRSRRRACRAGWPARGGPGRACAPRPGRRRGAACAGRRTSSPAGSRRRRRRRRAPGSRGR